MPTYDYKCKACGNAFEEFQSMSAPHLKKCPKCGKNKLERLIGTGAALMFKGSGFYITDYRSDSYKKAAEADKGGGGGGGGGGDAAKSEPSKAETAASKSDSAAGTKADSKPESKSESKAEAKSESRSESKFEPKREQKSKGKKSSKSD